MSTDTVSPLRQRMIEDMNARKLGAHTQRGHIHSCKRFAAFLKRSPDTATAEDIRLFQLHLTETGASICNRNRIMTGLKFLLRVTLRRLDLAAEIYHIREPQKIPQVMSQDEARRLLAVATSLKVRTLLSLGYVPPTRTGLPRAKASAPTAALQPQQAKTRGEIPIAPAVPPVHTFRDFVPWRFSAAGHRSAWRAASSRRPKTCTTTDICSAANHGPIRSLRR